MHLSCNDLYKCVACSLVLPSGSLGWLQTCYCLIFWLEKLLVPSSDSDRVIIKIVNELKKRHVGQFSLLEHPHQWMQNTKCAHIDAKAIRIYQCERLIFEPNFFGL